MVDADSVREFLLWSKSAIIGGIAGMVGYLYQVIQRGLPLKWAAFGLYVVIAAGLGLTIENAWAWTADEITGKPWPGMGAVIALAGSSAFALVDVVLTGVPALMRRVLDWLGGKLK